MAICGIAAGFFTFDYFVQSGLKHHGGNVEYHFVTSGSHGGAFVLGSAIIGFLTPGLIVFYLYKRSGS